MAPEFPALEVPDARVTSPLAKSIPAFPEANFSGPELFSEFAPLEISTSPPMFDASEPACADMEPAFELLIPVSTCTAPPSLPFDDDVLKMIWPDAP
jgi:hypothetical protein